LHSLFNSENADGNCSAEPLQEEQLQQPTLLQMLPVSNTGATDSPVKAATQLPTMASHLQALQKSRTSILTPSDDVSSNLHPTAGYQQFAEISES
jgi:hypothetical protein